MSEGENHESEMQHMETHGPGNETLIDFFAQSQTTSHHFFGGSSLSHLFKEKKSIVIAGESSDILCCAHKWVV